MNRSSIFISSENSGCGAGLLDQPSVALPPGEEGEVHQQDGEEEGIERAWSSVPDDPLNYHFLYHVLDADEHGHPPKINGARNPQFKQSSKSALHYIADSNNKVMILMHNIAIKPTV